MHLVTQFDVAKQSTVTEPRTTKSVTAGKLGHTAKTVLDSDDESLAAYMGQISSHKQQRVPGMAGQVSSVFISFHKCHNRCILKPVVYIIFHLVE